MRPYLPTIRRQLIESSLKRWEMAMLTQTDEALVPSQTEVALVSPQMERHDSVHVKLVAER